MMKMTLQAALKDAISKVLETMFFSSLEFTDAPLPEEWKAWRRNRVLACRLEFTGPLGGSVTVLVPDLALAALAAGFMGMETREVTEDQLTGTMMELTNMITGNLFSIYDPETVYKLDIPRIIPVQEDPLRQDRAGSTVCFLRTTEGPMKVTITK